VYVCNDLWSFEGTVSAKDKYDFDTHWWSSLKTTFLGTPGGRQLLAEVQTQVGAWMPANPNGFWIIGGPEPLRQLSNEDEAIWVGSGLYNIETPAVF